MASTSDQVSSTTEAASARVKEMVSIVREYATKYSEAAPQGELLNEIKTDLTAAADKVRCHCFQTTNRAVPFFR